MFHKFAETLINAGLLMGLVIAPAQAYLDPGTGSILLQLLLGGFAGLLVVVKLYWHSLQLTFRRLARGPRRRMAVPFARMLSRKTNKAVDR